MDELSSMVSSLAMEFNLFGEERNEETLNIRI